MLAATHKQPPYRRATTAVILSLGLIMTGCAAQTESQPSESEASAAPAETTTAAESPTAESTESQQPVETSEFTTQGGTFSFEVPTDWNAESTETATQDVELTGVPYEMFSITSPLGDIVIDAAVHGGPTSGDGWRSQHWEVADIEELDVPVHEQKERVYLRTDLEWLGEDDEAVDPETMGWNSGDYRLVSKIVSQNSELAVGDDDQDARLEGWAYWSPVPDPYQGETSFISVAFSQELIETLTGETDRDAAVEAFLNGQWYQTTTDILRSMEYVEPDASELPIQP